MAIVTSVTAGFAIVGIWVGMAIGSIPFGAVSAGVVAFTSLAMGGLATIFVSGITRFFYSGIVPAARSGILTVVAAIAETLIARFLVQLFCNASLT